MLLFVVGVAFRTHASHDDPGVDSAAAATRITHHDGIDITTLRLISSGYGRGGGNGAATHDDIRAAWVMCRAEEHSNQGRGRAAGRPLHRAVIRCA